MPRKTNVCPNLLIYLRICRKLSIDEIANIIGVSFGTIQNHCSDLGLTKHNIGKRPPTRTRRAKIINREFTKLELLAYEIGIEKGQTTKEIAKEHSREESFVKEALNIK